MIPLHIEKLYRILTHYFWVYEQAFVVLHYKFCLHTGGFTCLPHSLNFQDKKSLFCYFYYCFCYNDDDDNDYYCYY